MIRRMSFQEAVRRYSPGQRLNELPDVSKIIQAVRDNGEAALNRFTRELDGVQLSQNYLDEAEIKATAVRLNSKQKMAMKQSIDNLRRVAEQTLERLQNLEIEVQPGVTAGVRLNPIDRIGIYVPGGKYPLISTLLMCAIPAQVAGVKEIIVSSPPTGTGQPAGSILAAAKLLGIREVLIAGGAQAIAAMAYGTPNLKPVDKIVGPGNAWVTAAKKYVAGQVGIDFIAGPTEVVIIADQRARPDYVAADMLAQAEHDERSAAVCITLSKIIADCIEDELQRQLHTLKTKRVASKSLAQHSAIVTVKSPEEAVKLCNLMAPEHLELQTEDNAWYAERLSAYGTLFIGPYSVEALGDYNCGVNHTLPTNGVARYRGGLSVLDFVKLQTTLEIHATGFARVKEGAVVLAEWEGLSAHAASIRCRES